MWRRIRIGVLLLILFVVAGGTWSDRQRTTDWSSTLWVGVFPVNGDDRPATARYIAALEREQYGDIEEFFTREAAEYGVTLEQPVRMVLYPQVTALPPQLEPGTGVAGRIWWSLKLRYYTWQQAGDTRSFPVRQDAGAVLGRLRAVCLGRILSQRPGARR